ncbi:uncharacterized protein LOC125236705 isoform X2 [Leguminivora glycinivorella]|uniref:uncharacterized protein LOC125236705 isoform X2 n=1 Tax=Leguminivora glycinivorella TaxID=1035111 RepID=UPI00200F4556|nr:uncharacterized protein LOC125236705 isoform X2 [Leguminivora glycinivorella]
MFSNKLIFILQVLHVCCGNWASEWMSQVQDEFGSVKDINARMNYDADLKQYEDQELQIPTEELPKLSKVNESNEGLGSYVSTPTLQTKLEAALSVARELLAKLKEKIALVSERETTLKENIATGRSGVSVVTVHTLAGSPRSYLIRDGAWTSCQGLLQLSYGKGGPSCVGVETPTKPDPCVFNSVTKYETIPLRRRAEYMEDDFLCLKSGFNTTLERYLTVPRTVVNDTCKNGVVRSLEDNVQECGVRVLSEYVYYPGAARGPREYCDSDPPACRLLAAWHLSNTTIEHFEFLKDDPAFKAFFIKSQ